MSYRPTKEGVYLWEAVQKRGTLYVTAFEAIDTLGFASV